MLLLLHSAFEDVAKEEVGGSALNSHGNYIADHGKSWKYHGIVFLNFCGNPALKTRNIKIATLANIEDPYEMPHNAESQRLVMHY